LTVRIDGLLEPLEVSANLPLPAVGGQTREPKQTRTWCRAAGKLATVVAFQTFFMGALKKAQKRNYSFISNINIAIIINIIFVILTIIIMNLILILIVINVAIVKRTYSSVARCTCGSAREPAAA